MNGKYRVLTIRGIPLLASSVPSAVDARREVDSRKHNMYKMKAMAQYALLNITLTNAAKHTVLEV